MKRLAILGASGHGSVVADAALAGGWTRVEFYDDAHPRVAVLGPWEVKGRTADLLAGARGYDGIVIAIGDNPVRLAKLRELGAAGISLATVVHPSAVVSPYAVLGAGSVVFARAVVNPFAQLGACCIVNTAATVDHDCRLADAVHVSPGAHLGGGVTVGECTWIGIGSSVKNNVTIGARVTIGAGAAVVEDVADGATVVGVPARPLNREGGGGAERD